VEPVRQHKLDGVGSARMIRSIRKTLSSPRRWPEHDVLQLDLAFGLAAADVDVVLAGR